MPLTLVYFDTRFTIFNSSCYRHFAAYSRQVDGCMIIFRITNHSSTLSLSTENADKDRRILLKKYLKQTGREDMNWILMAHGVVQWG